MAVILLFLPLLGNFWRNNPIEIKVLFANQRRHTLNVINEVEQTDLYFCSHKPYGTNSDYRTAAKSLPFSLLEENGMGKYDMVPRGGIEPP